MRQITSIFLAIFMAFSFSESAFARASIEVSVNNRAMKRAIKDARRTLPVFLSHVLKTSGEGALEASVKVAFDVGDGKIVDEYVWVGPFRENENGTFTGFLANDPVHLSQKFGEEVTFELSQILDWSIWLADEKNYGSYTTRALLDMLPQEQAQQIEQQLSEEPLPKSWTLK